MKSIRIEPAQQGRVLLIDVVCDCGRNALKSTQTGDTSFKHAVLITDDTFEGVDDILVCDCGKKYRLHPQRGHIHVFGG